MRLLRPIAVLTAAIGAGALMVSGGSSSDPRTPASLPGLPPPFLGTALAGSGRLTAAIDAYGDVVDLRAHGPASAPQIAVSPDAQSEGAVPPDSGIVIAAGSGPDPARPLWHARAVRQRYLRGTSVVRTIAFLRGGGWARILDAASTAGSALVRRITVSAPRRHRVRLRLSMGPDAAPGRCEADPRPNRHLAADHEAARTMSWSGRGTLRVDLVCAFDARFPRAPSILIGEAVRSDRAWLERSAPLGPGAPDWARRMYDRSLLVLRALTDRRSGAVAAGARDGWAYVWPRDAAAVSLALRAAGHPGTATRIARFLDGIDLDLAARFDGSGKPVPGRPAQGDAQGWHRVADRAGRRPVRAGVTPWRGSPDYGERAGDEGDYLANAIAAGEPASRIIEEFGAPGGVLVREAGEGSTNLDSAIAWAVRPFNRPALESQVRSSLDRLLTEKGRFGIPPSLDWPGGREPWSAPTAWVAWTLAALGERPRASSLLRRLRDAATPAGDLPERVDSHTGLPESTTPLAWSHAFAILALREVWAPR